MGENTLWRVRNLNEKILIIEDNPQNMRLLEMTLEGKDYILLKARDGKEGLDMAIREHPALIIMDIQLPRMSGLEVTKRLRQMAEFNHVPIIALTAYSMKGDREKFLEAGCNVYMPKPINTRALPEMIAQMLQARKQDNR